VKALQGWAERRTERAVERAKERIVRSVDVPGVAASRTERGVELRGRGLVRRMMTDPRLRWIGGLFR
jgi:hypothetical protein